MKRLKEDILWNNQLSTASSTGSFTPSAVSLPLLWVALLLL